jgi:hypothetical protein
LQLDQSHDQRAKVVDVEKDIGFGFQLREPSGNDLCDLERHGVGSVRFRHDERMERVARRGGINYLIHRTVSLRGRRSAREGGAALASLGLMRSPPNSGVLLLNERFQTETLERLVDACGGRGSSLAAKILLDRVRVHAGRDREPASIMGA